MTTVVVVAVLTAGIGVGWIMSDILRVRPLTKLVYQMRLAGFDPVRPIQPVQPPKSEELEYNET